QPAPRRVPEDERELAAQVPQARRTLLLVEVEHDLAVGAGAEAVPLPLEAAPDALEAVQLAVGHQLQAAVFVGDRLVAGREIDDAEAGAADAGGAAGIDP